MEKQELYHELRVIAVRSIFLNLAAYLFTSCFLGFTLSFATGLLLGTALLFVDLVLLYLSLQQTMAAAGKHGRAKLIGSYAGRLTLIGVVFWLCLQTKWINAYAIVVPLFYPRLIYVGSAMLHRKGDGL